MSDTIFLPNADLVLRHDGGETRVPVMRVEWPTTGIVDVCDRDAWEVHGREFAEVLADGTIRILRPVVGLASIEVAR